MNDLLDLKNIGSGGQDENSAPEPTVEPISEVSPAVADAVDDSSAPAVFDPNAVQVTVSDTTSPVVLLFGPQRIGKSQTMMRLSRYLRERGFEIIVDKKFRSDDDYKLRCKEFMLTLPGDEAFEPTSHKDFLLLKVIDPARNVVCQLLEAPGEDYFSMDSSKIGASDFPAYMKKIMMSLPNRKIWIFMTRPDWEVKPSVKDAYVKRIRNCNRMLMSPSDGVIIMYNRVDECEYLFAGKGFINMDAAIKAVKDEYPGLFEIFLNRNPITSLWRTYNFKFVPFSTGSYTTKLDGSIGYEPSPEWYPEMLWNAIMKNIRG